MQVDAHGQVTTWESALVPLKFLEAASRIERAYFSGVGKLGGDREALSASWAGVPLVRMGQVEQDLSGDVRTWRRPILGGALARQGGWFIIRAEPHGDRARVSIKLEGFTPRLPGGLYRATQGPVHQAYTRAFLAALR